VTDDWRSGRFAPAPGTPIATLDALPRDEARELRFGEGRGAFSMLVVRRGDGACAYVNACPHVWLPLTFRSPRVLSADGARLVCSNHGAEFAVEDGRALAGPAQPGCALDRIPLAIAADGRVAIGGEPA
jgi:nitrite reductase/ring-hydroxylating ferredoxin subunit